MDRFLHNKWVMKGIAFLIALMLWMIVALDQSPDTNVGQVEDQVTLENVQVEAIYDEELYSLLEFQDTVQVLLSGRRSLLNVSMLRSEPYRIYADLTELGEGEHRVELEHEGFPAEVEVNILPQEIRVVLEEKEARSVPVEMELTGELPEGYSSGTLLVVPEEVHVIAPISVLEQVATVKGSLDLGNAREQIEQEVDLRAYDAEGNEIEAEISPDSVEVEVPILSPSESVPLELNVDDELPDDVSLIAIESSVDVIEVFAPLDELENIESIEQDIDLSNITSSQTLELDIPLQANWERTDPSSVQVRVEVGPTRERLFSSHPVQVQGLEREYEFNFTDPASGEVSLSVFGSEELLDELSSADVEVFVDVSDLGVGEHTLEAEVELPPHLTHSPQEIPIQIEIIEGETQDDD